MSNPKFNTGDKVKPSCLSDINRQARGKVKDIFKHSGKWKYTVRWEAEPDQWESFSLSQKAWELEKVETTEQFEVLIIESQTDEIIKRMGPFAKHKAEKVRDGVEINMNHCLFDAQVVDVST
jgi:5-deoxy-D-glucuronate isomerase